MAKKTESVVTCELQAHWPTDPVESSLLADTFKQTNHLAKDTWNQFGGLGMSTNGIYSKLKKGQKTQKPPSAMDVDTKTNKKTGINNGIRKSTTLPSCIEKASFQNYLNDIKANWEAAKRNIRKEICKRYSDTSIRNEIYAKLDNGTWTQHHWLHKKVRKLYPHGKRTAENNFSVSSAGYDSVVIDGQLCIVLNMNMNVNGKRITRKITLVTTSNGKNVLSRLTNVNIRIMQVGNMIRILYTKKIPSVEGSKGMVGIDKGYTEVFVDSKGVRYGGGLGEVLTEYSDFINGVSKNKNRIRDKISELRKSGQHAEADKLTRHNVGSQGVDKKKKIFQNKIQMIISSAVKELFERYDTVVLENLDFSGYHYKWKAVNRKLNIWTKGRIQSTLETKAKQYNVKLIIVNAAYTSQMCHKTGRLLSKPLGRNGDKFTHEDETISHADHNAAINILNRNTDKEITPYMKHTEVKKILLKRNLKIDNGRAI